MGNNGTESSVSYVLALQFSQTQLRIIGSSYVPKSGQFVVRLASASGSAVFAYNNSVFDGSYVCYTDSGNVQTQAVVLSTTTATCTLDFTSSSFNAVAEAVKVSTAWLQVQSST